MKRAAFLLSLLAVAGLTASARPAAPEAATGDPCSLPTKKPVWIDFADGSVPFWEEFAKPGVVAAASNFIFPPQIRARGAKTVYFDLNFTRRTGSPTEPGDPSDVSRRGAGFHLDRNPALEARDHARLPDHARLRGPGALAAGEQVVRADEAPGAGGSYRGARAGAGDGLVLGLGDVDYRR